MSLRILLVLPAGERVSVTFEQPEVPRRAMLRFSVLPLTVVAALTPSHHHVRIIDENVELLDFNVECDITRGALSTWGAKKQIPSNYQFAVILPIPFNAFVFSSWMAASTLCGEMKYLRSFGSK